MTTKPVPPPNPDYVPAKTRRLPDGTVEVDGGKWVELLQTAEFFSRGKRL